jgi:glycosyltransferase involved in cell wall biosynthesis
MSKKNIRILQILPGGHVCGGIEFFVMNYYREMVKLGVQFDFLVHYKQKGYFDDEIKKLGGRIYYFSVREDKNVIRYIYQLCKFFYKHKEYKIIHGHMPGMAPIYFFIAKLFGIKYRISHCHVTETENTLKGKILKQIIKIIPYFSNVYYACSKEAGYFMYKNREFKIIHNAINTKKFVFDKDKREKLRKALNIDENFVIGHVGRFNLQKNHGFLINVFNEVYLINKRAKLLLIGEGPLENKIKEQVKKLGLEKNVIFLGVRNDIEDLYNVMDCFVLPSLFEGLPIVGVEAQASGLPCYFSKNITEEIGITQLANFISLSESPKLWAEKIIKNRHIERRNMLESIIKSGYSITCEVKKLKEIYINLIKE